LLLAAVFLLPVDIALRRIVLTRADGQRLWLATTGRLWPRVQPQGTPSGQVARLFRAKERAARHHAGRPPESGSTVAFDDEPVQSSEDAAGSPGAMAEKTDKPDRGVEAPVDEGVPPRETLAARLLERRKRRDPKN
jgi:hypothetical protein